MKGRNYVVPINSFTVHTQLFFFFFSKIQREVEEQDNAGIIQFGIIGIKKTVILFPENFHLNLYVNSTPKEQIILSSPCILGLRQEDKELGVILHYKSRPWLKTQILTEENY